MKKKAKTQSTSPFIQEFQNIFFEKYSFYINAFAQKNVDMKVEMKRVSYIKGFITIAAEVELIPKKEYRENERYWKYFGVKLVTLRKNRLGQYIILQKHKDSFLFKSFLKKNLKKLSKKTPCDTCRENIGNLLLRILCFLRFHKFPCSYRGRSLLWIYFILVMLITILIIATSRNPLQWDYWYSRHLI